MRTDHFLQRIGVVIAVALVAWSCSTSTTSISSWTDQTARFTPYKKLVVASKLEPLGMRQEIEKTVVKELRDRGVAAVASLDIMPPNASRDSLKMCVSTERADGILIIAPLGSTDIVAYVPEQTTITRPWPYRYRSYLDYWDVTEVYTQGGYEEKVGDLVVRQINLWDCESDRLIWQGESSTDEYFGSEDAVTSFAGRLVDRLVRDGLVVPVSRAQR